MGLSVEQIKTGYRDISRVKDSAAAYADYHEALTAEEPDVETILAAAKQDSKILWNIGTVRYTHRSIHGRSDGQYFRGSGMVIVGNDEGEILAADYARIPDGLDPVDGHYPNYQFAALRKAAFGLTVVRLGLARLSGDERYLAEEEFFQEHGLSLPNDPPHHLGHAALTTSRGVLVAGVSGMLPSDNTRREMKKKCADIIERDYQKEWVNWEYDELAGLYDRVAAETVLDCTDSRWQRFGVRLQTPKEDLRKSVQNLH